MTVPTLTPEIVAQIFKRDKPHLIAIEEEAKRLGYGSIEVTITVRAGAVEKMQFWSGRTWLRDKDNPT